MIQERIQALADQIEARINEIYPDAAIIFLSSWKEEGRPGGVNFIHGDADLIKECFTETQPDIRFIEACNLGHSEKNDTELGRLLGRFRKEADLEIKRLYEQIEPLVLDPKAIQDRSPFVGQVLMIIGWRELSLYFHRTVEVTGMIPNIVTLFNTGKDSFFKAYQKEDHDPY